MNECRMPDTMLWRFSAVILTTNQHQEAKTAAEKKNTIPCMTRITKLSWIFRTEKAISRSLILPPETDHLYLKINIPTLWIAKVLFGKTIMTMTIWKKTAKAGKRPWRSPVAETLDCHWWNTSLVRGTKWHLAKFPPLGFVLKNRISCFVQWLCRCGSALSELCKKSQPIYDDNTIPRC